MFVRESVGYMIVPLLFMDIKWWATCTCVSHERTPPPSGADPGFRRGGGVRTFRRGGGGGSYRNFRSGSKLLQGPGQINKQNKIADSRRGGGSEHPPKKPVSAHTPLFPCQYRIPTDLPFEDPPPLEEFLPITPPPPPSPRRISRSARE